MTGILPRSPAARDLVMKEPPARPPSGDRDGPRKPARRKKRLGSESIESRILMSGTWIDPDTNEQQSDPTTGGDVFEGSDTADGPRSGGLGADTMFGSHGNDTLHGGTDLDVLMGGSGADALHGEAGDDVVDGGEGDDTLSGGSGADVLIGGGGSDSMTGETGDDVFRFTDAKHGDVYTVDGGDDIDTIDISEFGSGALLGNDGSTLTVDLGNSESFTVNYTNVENVVTADDTGVNRGAGRRWVGRRCQQRVAGHTRRHRQQRSGRRFVDVSLDASRRAARHAERCVGDTADLHGADGDDSDTADVLGRGVRRNDQARRRSDLLDRIGVGVRRHRHRRNGERCR